MGSSTLDSGQEIQMDKEREIANTAAELLTEVFNKVDRNPTNMWAEHKLIREKIDKITALQEELSDTNERIRRKRGEGNLAEFLAWAKKKGIDHEGVTVEEDSEKGYQLVATRDLAEGEIVVAVPRSAIYSLDQAKRSTALKRFFARDHMASKMDNVGLALGVCSLQIKEGSSWQPYLDVLPPSFDCPLYYSVQQFEDLRASPVFEDALNHYRAVSRQFCYFLSVIDENNKYDKATKEERSKRDPPPLYGTAFTVPNFTYDLYKWAVCTVATRINQIPSDYEKNGDAPRIIPCLIPILDFANHAFFSSFKHTPGYSDSADVAALPVNDAVKRGDPVNIQYGQRTTADFFIHNAFSPLENPYNKYKLRIGIPKTDKCLPERMRQMASLGYSNTSTVYVFEVFPAPEIGAQPFDEALVTFARVFVANPPTDENVYTSDSLRKGVDFLIARFSLLLRGYKDSLLEGKGNVAILLRGEKAILEDALLYCQLWKERL